MRIQFCSPLCVLAILLVAGCQDKAPQPLVENTSAESISSAASAEPDSRPTRRAAVAMHGATRPFSLQRKRAGHYPSRCARAATNRTSSRP